VPKHQARAKNNKNDQRPSRHGEPNGEQLQKVPGSFATEMAMANYLAWRSNGEQFQKVENRTRAICHGEKYSCQAK